MLTEAEKGHARHAVNTGNGTDYALGRHMGAAAVALNYLDNNNPGMAAYVLKDALEFSQLIDTLEEARCTSS